MVTRFSPAAALTDFGSGVSFRNDLYFTATVGQATGLYKSDGTAAGTALVKALPGGSPQASPQFTVVNNTLFFVWNNDLWESDGTAAGTTFVKDFGGAQGQSPHGLTNFNGTLYFTAPDLANPGNSAALWKTDGTAAGTAEVNLAPDPINDVFNLTASGGKLFFQSSGTSVWESDGTATGTAPLPVLPDVASGLAVGNGVVYYAYGYQAAAGQELFDVGAINGSRLAPLGPDFPAEAVTDLTLLNNKLFFLAQRPDSSWQLWEAGGPTGPMSPIASFGAAYDPVHGSLPDLTAYNGAVYFAGWDATHGVEPWKTDGTAAGIVPVDDVNPGLAGSEPPLGDGSGASSYQLTASGGKLLFAANDGAHGDELWETDGTTAGSVLVADINPGPQGSDPQNLIDVNGTLFFTASDGTHGEQLWAVPAAPPSATGQPITAVQGQPFSGAVATFTDPNPLTAASYTATITWGDGHTSAGTVAAQANGLFSVSGGNDYAQPGTYAVGVQINRPGGGSATATTTATVSPVASGQVFETTAGQPFSGMVATFSDPGPAAASSDTATISWGDGHTSAGTVTARGNGLFAVSGTNTYATGPATYPVAVNISLTGGGKGVAYSAALVSSSASGPPIKATEGQPFSGVVATFSDPNPAAAATDTASISWADGQTSAGTVTALGGGRFAVSGSHTYAHAGTYEVGVQIGPAVGGSLSAAAAITVADQPFWATRTFLHVAQWQPVTGVLGTLTDLNPLASAGDFTATIDWGDGSKSAGTLRPAGQGTFNITGAHTYALAGARTLTVTVTDEGGRTTTTNPLMAVDAAPPPIAAAGQSITTQEGRPFSGVVATFSDPSPAPAGAYAAAIGWGDGQASAGTVAALGNGRFAVSGSNTYHHAGTYAVSVSAFRPNGVSAAATTTANVTDAPFWATRTFQHVGQGQPVTGVLGTLVDLNPSASAGDFTVVIDWGDGTKSPGLVLPKGKGTFDIAGSHDYTLAGARTLDVAITDEGGRTVTTNPLVTVDSR
jgi:ELWxxDGT repeat protein